MYFTHLYNWWNGRTKSRYTPNNSRQSHKNDIFAENNYVLRDILVLFWHISGAKGIIYFVCRYSLWYKILRWGHLYFALSGGPKIENFRPKLEPFSGNCEPFLFIFLLFQLPISMYAYSAVTKWVIWYPWAVWGWQIMHLLAQNWIKCVNMAFLALKCNFFITRENMAVKTFFKLISYFHGSYKQGQTSSSYIINEMGL